MVGRCTGGGRLTSAGGSAPLMAPLLAPIRFPPLAPPAGVPAAGMLPLGTFAVLTALEVGGWVARQGAGAGEGRAGGRPGQGEARKGDRYKPDWKQ